MLNYNDVIAKLYKKHDQLLNDDRLDEALRLYVLLDQVSHLSDPSIDVITKLNKILNNLNN